MGMLKEMFAKASLAAAERKLKQCPACGARALEARKSLYSRLIGCRRCDAVWDEDGFHLKPAYDRAELSRRIGQGIPMASATLLRGDSRLDLPAEKVAAAWAEFLIETDRVVHGREPDPAASEQLRSAARIQPKQFIDQVLGRTG